ncbi:hypothetical protein [Hymenobacter sp.]|uniref:hypothetical protein n=1 Tax=Hymenobacter sp. TaxID=1898978 RepID=UPI00286A13D8|nr:hypothetical protein [Hymenobacter sp.]
MSNGPRKGGQGAHFLAHHVHRAGRGCANGWRRSSTSVSPLWPGAGFSKSPQPHTSGTSIR